MTCTKFIDYFSGFKRYVDIVLFDIPILAGCCNADTISFYEFCCLNNLELGPPEGSYSRVFSSELYEHSIEQAKANLVCR